MAAGTLKDFNTEKAGRATEGHGEGKTALRAKRQMLSPWPSVVLRVLRVKIVLDYPRHRRCEICLVQV